MSKSGKTDITNTAHTTYLTDFMIENRLICLNTNYQKREGKLLDLHIPNNSKAQTDYVFIIRNGKKAR